MKQLVGGLSVFCLVVGLYAGEAPSLSADGSSEVVTPEQLVHDEWLKTYLSRGCTLVYTAKTTRERSVVDGRLAAYDTNGVKVLEWSFKDGQLHGEAVAYYASGRLSSRTFYELGVAQGAELYWNEDGSLYRTASYAKGEKQGLETYWNPDGSINSRIDRRAGVVQSIELYESGVCVKRLTGDAAKNFFRDQGREAARKLLEKQPQKEGEKTSGAPGAVPRESKTGYDGGR